MGYRHDGAELPDTTDVFVTGETVKDPECLPQDWDSLYVATLESIRNPIGMEPLASYAGPGKKVVIVIPDIVKGGTQPTAHRKVAIRACLDELEGHDVVIDCIAKNFETLEPGSSFRLLRQYLVERYGHEEAARRIVFTGTIGSPLEDLCCAEGYTFVPFATNVGGRYTALTEVHLLPMAVAGVDIRALVAGARTMERRLRTAPVRELSVCLCIGSQHAAGPRVSCRASELFRASFPVVLKVVGAALRRERGKGWQRHISRCRRVLRGAP